MMADPYKLTAQAMSDLRSRTHEKIKRLFPEGAPEEIMKRIDREEQALWNSPVTYGLLIVHEAIQVLRYHRFTAILEGDLDLSYYAWLMDLTEPDPYDMALCYQDMGLRIRQIIEDGRISAPIEISVTPAWGKPACLELLRMYADKWGFWLWECPDGGWKLISLSHSPEDIYAANAPIIRITGQG